MPRTESNITRRNPDYPTDQLLFFGIPAAVVALLLTALVLPVFLAAIYWYFRRKAGRLRVNLGAYGHGLWLTQQEIEDFLWEKDFRAQRLATRTAHNEMIRRKISRKHEQGVLSSVPVNLDGKLSRLNRQGRTIRMEIEELEASRRTIHVDDLFGTIECRQPRASWNHLNSLLKAQNVTLFALMGWAVVASYYLPSYCSGASPNLIIDPVVMMGGAVVGAISKMTVCRNPALRYMPQPAWVTCDNVENPSIELPQRDHRWVRLLVFGIWLMIAALCALKGANY